MVKSSDTHVKTFNRKVALSYEMALKIKNSIGIVLKKNDRGEKQSVIGLRP